MDRILRGASGTITLRLYDADGNLVSAGAQVTASVRDSAGVAVVGSPFTAANPSTGIYTVNLTLAVLDRYTVTWNLPDTTTRTTEFEVVGGFFFSIADLRSYDPVLADATAYPASKLTETRESVEERIEQECKVAFVPRGRRVMLNGDGRGELFVPDVELVRVVAAKIGGVALTGGELTDLAVYPMGLVVRQTLGVFSSGWRNVEILYEHGFSSPPEPIRRAALMLARHQLLRSPLEQSDRATAMFTELGAFRMSVAGRDGPTGLPEVDAVLAQFNRDVRTFA